MVYNTNEHVAARCSRNFKIVMEFQNQNFNSDKPRQYDAVLKEAVKPVSFWTSFFAFVS